VIRWDYEDGDGDYNSKTDKAEKDTVMKMKKIAAMIVKNK
jgi:hypothetical protein